MPSSIRPSNVPRVPTPPSSPPAVVRSPNPAETCRNAAAPARGGSARGRHPSRSPRVRTVGLCLGSAQRASRATLRYATGRRRAPLVPRVPPVNHRVGETQTFERRQAPYPGQPWAQNSRRGRAQVRGIALSLGCKPARLYLVHLVWNKPRTRFRCPCV